MTNPTIISRQGPVRGAAVVAPPFKRLTSLAVMTALFGGCVAMPKQPEPTTAATTNPQDISGTSTAAQASATGPKTEFHKTATERQRFQVHVDFGRVFESQGNFDAAVLEYQSALAVAQSRGSGELKPVDEALAHRRIGGALDQQGRFAQAELHYKKALKLSPRDPKIWNDAGYSFYLQGRWAEAEGALKTAARFAPDDERIRTNLGLTLAAAGRTDEALPLLSQTSGDATGHMNLGYALAATGKFDLARQQYEIALALRPDLDLAHRALAQLDRQQATVPDSRTTTLMARSGQTTRVPVVDPGVNQASTASALSRPPMPTRTLPESKAPVSLNSRATKPSAASHVEAGLPPLPASIATGPRS